MTRPQAGSMHRINFICLVKRTLLLLLALGVIACARQPEYEPPPKVGHDVVIDISGLKPGAPVFYTHHYKKKKISFFVVKIGDTVMSFLDACNTCYRYRRGYKFENGLLVCLYCKEKYSIEQIAIGTGNCFPIQLAGSVQDGKYRISLSILESKANRF
jgi:uncharacterized membrane protein